MIKVAVDRAVSVVLGGKEYLINDDKLYRELLIVLTNPDPLVTFQDTDFESDPSIEEGELRAIAERYSDFFKGYIARRAEKLNAQQDEITAGFEACEVILSKPELAEKCQEG